MFLKILGKNNGLAMVLTLAFFFLLISFVTTYFFMATSDIRLANRAADSVCAYYVADAGLADAFTQLRSYPNPPETLTIPPVPNYPVEPGGRTGSYTVTAPNDHAAFPTYTITSRGVFGSATKTLVLQVKVSSYSYYAYLSNTETSPTWGALWWITGMTTIGPVHTNGQLNIYGNPIFDGPVSQVASTINYYNGGPPKDNPDFEGGLTLGVLAIPFPTSDLITNVKTGAQQAQGLILTGSSTITLLSNGTMNVTNSAKGWTDHNTAMPSNKAVFVQSGTATVQGTLNGQLSIGCDGDIIVGGSILYHDKTNPNPAVYTGNDVLGLVAQNYVNVTSAAQPNNAIEIDAYIVAMTGSFQVQNFSTIPPGNMVQFGGLTNYSSGPTGTFDSRTGQLKHGYNQLQYYDYRLQNTLVPPWFPPTRDSTNKVVYTKIRLTES